MVDNIKTVGADPSVCPLEHKNKFDNTLNIKGRTHGPAPTQYKHNRRSLRLKHYDYAKSGYYFITICAQKREHLFGEIVDGVMGLNVAGEMVHTLWYAMKEDFPDIALHEFIIMPNHIHGIIEIKQHDKPVGADSISALEPMFNRKPTNEIQSQRADMESAPTVYLPFFTTIG